jgi:ATP-dependent helicase IRC3
MTSVVGGGLRDYQHECLRAVRTAYQRGVRRQLVCLPTGTGKTVVFSHFPGYFEMKKKMLVLAHREELLEQARDKLLRASPGLRVEIEQSDRRASIDADVVVASIATIGKTGSARVERVTVPFVIEEITDAAAPESIEVAAAEPASARAVSVRRSGDLGR